MTNTQLYRASGLAMVIGGLAFIVHIVARSAVTSGTDPVTSYREGLWVPINVLGLIGALLVLFGIPAAGAKISKSSGLAGLAGVVTISLAWIFFGVFLSLFAVLVAPWLAERAPTLFASSSNLPAGFAIAFVAALLLWLIGTVLMALPFLRGRVQPRWVGLLLPVSALWAIVGDLIAPNGPSTTFVINLLSNLGPVLLVIALGDLGLRMWSEHTPAGQTDSRPHFPAS